MSAPEKRDFRRDGCAWRVKMRLGQGDGREVGGEARNFSLGGMYVVSGDVDAPFILGARVHVEVEVSAAELVVLRTDGRVIRIEPLQEKGRPLIGVAIRFDSMIEYRFSSG